LIAAQPAAAHGFHLELQVEGGRVHGEAYFGDGEPPGEATWTVFHAGQSAPLASGKTDSKGHFDWSAPSSGTYRCEVKEVGLHVASAEVRVEVPAGALPDSPGATPAATPDTPDEARRKRRGRGGGGRGRVKRLLTGLGAIALLGLGMYRFQRRRREPPTGEDEAPEDEAPEGEAPADGAPEGEAPEALKPSPGDA
tara:strand:- start:28 stop:615 length:588 start_codon:yes stop_codon:yes gene_type:complete